MRLLVTADLHYNHPKSRSLARDLIAEMNAAGGDGVLIVGDTAAADGDALEQCLGLFKIPGPRLFVAGNHELWTLGPDSVAVFRDDLPRRVRSLDWQWLQSDPFITESAAIVGCLGWYDYSFAQKSLGIPDRFYAAKVSPGAAARLPEFQHLLAGRADDADGADGGGAASNAGRSADGGAGSNAGHGADSAAGDDAGSDAGHSADRAAGDDAGSDAGAAAEDGPADHPADVPPHAMEIVARWNDGRYIHLGKSDQAFLAEQLQTLAAQLDALKSVPRVIAAIHHLPFRELLPPSHSGQWDFAKAYLGSEKIGRLLLNHANVREVFCGHSHFPAEATIGHIRAVNLGSGYRSKTYLTLEL
jgi:predicted phosphodiesterase